MANLIKEHNSQFNIGCARDVNYLDYNLKKKKPISAHLNPFHETAKGITKGKSISSCSSTFFFRKKILMAEEPSENPEHLSFKEKLKRFQNKEASPSGSAKVRNYGFQHMPRPQAGVLLFILSHIIPILCFFL